MKMIVKPTISLKSPNGEPIGQIMIRRLNTTRSNREPEINTAERRRRLAAAGLNILQ